MHTAQPQAARGCHVLCELDCLCNSIQVVNDKQVILTLLHDLSGFGGILRLEPRTVHMVIMSESKKLRLRE